MKRALILTTAVLTAAGCAAIRDLRHDDDAYAKAPFYAKYLNTGSTLDAQITRTLDALRQNPSSAELHNTLGALLVEKGFPKDAEREFERSVNANGDYYPAWYNLGLVRASRGDELGARHAFSETVDLKPGHAAALFQLGLVEEKRQHSDRAVALYAKAFTINPALMQVSVNPRILDSSLIDLALLRMYPDEHARRTMQFQSVAPASHDTQTQKAPSPQPAAGKIVTPAAPPTDPSQQPVPTTTQEPTRRRRNPAAPTPVPVKPPA